MEYRGHRVIAGGRFQAGTFFTDDTLDGGGVHRRAEADMAGANGYLYWSRTLADALTIVGGVSYDHLRYPENHRFSPVSDGERSITRWNPKAGLIWSPAPSTSLQGAYAEALGGVSF